MKIVVTGAAGGLGSHVTAELLSRGHDLVAVDRRGTGDGRPTVVADVTDLTQMRAACAGCDALIHLAAIPSPRRAEPDVVFGNNALSTFAVLQAAADVGIERAVIASSASALGMAWAEPTFSPLYAPIDEEHPLRPADHYGLSKEVAERIGASIHRQSGMAVTALRFPWIPYGPRLAQAVTAVRSDPAERAPMRDLWSYALPEDVAAAAALAIETPGLGFDVLNVVAPDTLSEIPTEELIATYHPTTELRAPLPGSTPAWSTAKAAELLGFTAIHTWRDRLPHLRSNESPPSPTGRPSHP
ncbi:MAG TPA: NAD(P)-dependent oxidoreductase [Mycobacteriales bacterium]|jgi:nucleoside-diphosphate-sugar epimerase